MGANNADLNLGATGRLYAALKGVGRQVHIHTESDPSTAYNTKGVISLCGKSLDCDLTGMGNKPYVAVLSGESYPKDNDPIWNTHDVMQATCATCNTKARKLRGN
jgi:hypothetical protein